MDTTCIATIGCGVMGVDIAATAAGYGFDVVLYDIDDDALHSAQHRVNLALRHGQLLSAFPEKTTVGSVGVTKDLRSIVDCSIIVEAVNENAQMKVEVLQQIQKVAPFKPILTNTSGISIDALAQNIPDPECLIGVHFMNPAYLIKTVEVAKGTKTSESTLKSTNHLLQAIDRRAIMVRDSPGFVTSRLLHAMINDAASLVGEKVATAEQIDSLLQGCLGHPTGPLRTADLIGIDNLVDSLKTLFERTQDCRYQPSASLLQLIEAGHLGRKTGRGFYQY